MDAASPHRDVARAVAALVERAARRPPGELADVVAEVAAETWDAADVVLALATHELHELVSMTGAGRGRRAEPIDHGLAGRCFTEGTPVVDGPTTWVPVTHHGDRIGVLGVACAEPPDPAALTTYAGAVALHLAAHRRLDDGIEVARRTQEMTVGADLLHEVLPPLTYGDDRFALAAAMEPAYSSGGDALDHAVEGDVLHVMILDATGHGWGAALVSTVAVAAYRNARRAGEDLLGTWTALDRFVGDSGGDPDVARYATAVLLELHLGTGRLLWLTAGHPAPVVLRADGTADVLEAEAAPPLGTGLGGAPEVAEDYLEPGDVLALHTDGIPEAPDLDGHRLGLEGYLDFVGRALRVDGSLAERLRRVRRDLLARDDVWLTDDATVLLVEWLGAG